MKTTEQQKQKMRRYYQNNKEKFKEYDKKRWETNKDIIKEKNNAYYLKNKLELLQKSHKRYLENKEYISKHNKEYRIKNGDKIRELEHQDYLRNIKNKLKTARNYREKNKEIITIKRDENMKIMHNKFYARHIAGRKIKIPENQICMICNEKPAIQRDHRDYAKPLEVSFVCASCNKRLGGGLNAN